MRTISYSRELYVESVLLTFDVLDTIPMNYYDF